MAGKKVKKVLGIVGSPRDGNTRYLVSLALEECSKRGIATELLHTGKMDISPCTACDQCSGGKDCTIYDDFQAIEEKMETADGMIIGSPVYFGCVPAQLKALMDRTRPLRRRDSLKDAIGGAIAVGGSRNGGQEFVLHQIHNFFLIHGMVVAGDEKTMHFGGAAWGRNPGDAEKDSVGKETAVNLGRHVAGLVIGMSARKGKGRKETI